VILAEAIAAKSPPDEILGLQVRQQAFTLAITDSFTLIARASVLYLLVIASMERVPTQYRQVVAAPAGAP
jgi:MFS transporter, DHA2 family, multidrug resistance protein